MISTRHLRVTLIVSALGAVVGAIAAVMSVGVLVIDFSALGESISALGGQILFLAAGVGGVFGAVAGPTLGWSLLRRVPLGLGAGAVALGTILGALAGERLYPFNPYTPDVPGVVWGAMMGCSVTAVVLRLSPIGRAASRPSRDAV